MATVYEAQDTKLGRVVALKVLHAHLRDQPEARSRFYREAQSIARLSHPNIITVYEYGGESQNGDEAQPAYIAEEFLTGPTLRTWVQDYGRMPGEVVAALGWVVADALCEAHRQGIVHRDVKPENLMLHNNAVVKLTDFGIAHIRDAMHMTVTGQMLGSPAHMAPEQIDGGACDARTDLFSLGTVLYFLATAELPFAGTNAHQIIRKILSGEWTDPCLLEPKMGGHLADVIKRLMAIRPDDRFESAEQLRQVLGGWLSVHGIDTPRELLAGYFSNPTSVSDGLAKRAVEISVREGHRSFKTRSVRDAMHYFNRVLAYEPDNAIALKELRSIGTHRAPWVPYALAFALVAIGGAVGIAWMNRSSTPSSQTQILVKPAVITEAAPSIEPDASRVEVEPMPFAMSVRSQSKPKLKPSQARPTEPRPGESTSAPNDLTTPRWVAFRPFPLNVTVSVDGLEPRAFGPSFLGQSLSPGEHVFRVEGAQGCCEPLETKRTVPAGEGTFVLPLELVLRPASLYISSSVPADVMIDAQGGRAVSGRTRSVLSVPMGRKLSDFVTLTVSASGFRTHRQNIEVRAGQLKEVSVTLDPS